MSWGDLPAGKAPVTSMVATSSRTSCPDPSQLTTSDEPSAVKSMWLGNRHGSLTRLMRAKVWESRKSRLEIFSGTTMARVPSGVK